MAGNSVSSEWPDLVSAYRQLIRASVAVERGDSSRLEQRDLLIRQLVARGHSLVEVAAAANLQVADVLGIAGSEPP